MGYSADGDAKSKQLLLNNMVFGKPPPPPPPTIKLVHYITY